VLTKVKVGEPYSKSGGLFSKFGLYISILIKANFKNDGEAISILESIEEMKRS
jgi:hypothetical protein